MSDLAAIAEAAWRTRTMLNLNLQRIGEANDPVLNRNVVDALNDLNKHLPLAEDGWDWEPSYGCDGDPR